MKVCFCGNTKPFSQCCSPLIAGKVSATSAAELMRSRYSAYALGKVDYIFDTTHLSQRGGLSKTEILNWAKSNVWLRLEVLHIEPEIVEFKAYYKDRSGKPCIHHERSTFKKENGVWYYFDGSFYN